MKASEYKNSVKKSGGQYEDAVWFNIREAPFKIYGLYNAHDGKRYRRIPEEVAEATSAAVAGLNYNTAGGRFTFATDSPYISIIAEMYNMTIMLHMPRTGSSGFDIYKSDGKTEQYVSTVFPCRPGQGETYSSSVNSHTTFGNVANFLVNFPLYDSVCEVYVGVAPDAELCEAAGMYDDAFPMVFYGSSITQGGCVSRPGNAYEGFISRRFHRDYINLGFSGSGRAEDAIVDYMASLKMSVFVSDYDHNAPTPEYLEATHHKMYEKIRAAHPDLPYIMISCPDCDRNPPDAAARTEIIRRSYEKAIADGDKNVYFIDGKTLFDDDCRDACTVDATHPNDLGHYRMGKVIGDLIGKILEK